MQKYKSSNKSFIYSIYHYIVEISNVDNIQDREICLTLVNCINIPIVIMKTQGPQLINLFYNSLIYYRIIAILK